MRYLLLIALNTPLVLLAFVNMFTQYKMKKISSQRFFRQLFLWAVILLVIVGSFPAYNLSAGRDIFESRDLSTFDIVQTTVIVFLIYILFNQRRKVEASERRLQDLHQELSIKLSERK